MCGCVAVSNNNNYESRDDPRGSIHYPARGRDRQHSSPAAASFDPDDGGILLRGAGQAVALALSLFVPSDGTTARRRCFDVVVLCVVVLCVVALALALALPLWRFAPS